MNDAVSMDLLERLSDFCEKVHDAREVLLQQLGSRLIDWDS